MTNPVAEDSASRLLRLPWLSVLIWPLALMPLYDIAVHPELFQWDFGLYYSAGMTADRGLDPYDYALRNSIHYSPNMEFLYPPLTLYLFRPFTSLPYDGAYLLWFSLKLLALVLLLILWHRKFEALSPRYPLALFLLLAFSATIYKDFAAGNIAIFEQLVFWLGFSFFVSRQYVLFGLCIALLSQFKLQPIVFLGLLLIVEQRPQWRAAAASIVAFLALFSLNYLLQPVLMRAFVERMLYGGGNLYELGANNPSILALIREVTSVLSKRLYELPAQTDMILYLIAAIAIVTIFLYCFISYRKRNPDYDVRILIYASCFLFAVAAARMKDYSYVLCLLPTLAMLRRWKNRLDLIPVVLVLVCAPAVTTYSLPYFTKISTLFYAYLPWFAAGVMLVLCLNEFRKSSGMSASPASGDLPRI